MSCKKVTNPCKICLGPVKQKTGLQCQGACESWVHYTCLNYTPGKIQDIKTGVITVTCPCPDCKTSIPKEILRDPPFSCNNIMCPANNPPACEGVSCQANQLTTSKPAPTIPPGTLMDCGEECINYLQSAFPTDASDPCMQGHTVSACNLEPVPPPKTRPKARIAPAVGSGGAMMPGGPGGAMVPSISTVEHICNTVGELTQQINELLGKMQQTTGGESRGYQDNDDAKQKCPQDGPKALCPKPCYCPGNPARKQ